MKYSLISCDLDDTVFGPDLVITPRTQRAVDALKEAGVKICINTGRFYSTAYPHAQRLGIDSLLLGLCQGAAVVSAPDKTLLSSCFVPQATAVELLKYAEERDMMAHYYTLDEFYRDHVNEWELLYEKLSRREGITLTGGRLSELLDFDPLKVLYVADEETIERTRAEMVERYGDTLEITVSRPTYLEFNRPGATKGKAVQKMAEYYGIPMSETVAIGDALNDVSMIRDAALGIAMGNATDYVKQFADRVTLPCEEEGFAYAVENFILPEL